jgi:hypothetical protein
VRLPASRDGGSAGLKVCAAKVTPATCAKQQMLAQTGLQGRSSPDGPWQGVPAGELADVSAAQHTAVSPPAAETKPAAARSSSIEKTLRGIGPSPLPRRHVGHDRRAR